MVNLRKMDMSKILLIAMYLTACFCVLIDKYAMITGTLLFVIMAVLSLTDKYVYTIPLVFVINDGLGTAIMGHVSFYWVSLVLAVWNWLYLRKGFTFSKKAFWFLMISAIYVTYMYFVQYRGSIREPIRTMAFYILFMLILEDVERAHITLSDVLLHVGLACTITTFHMAITGGIDYTIFGYEDAGGGWVQTSRFGLLGTGTGDPNFSGLRILLGCICVFYSKLKPIIKAVILAVMMYCIVRTVSITALVVLVILGSIGILAERNVNRRIKYSACIALIVVMAITLLSIIPLGDTSEQLELLVHRIDEKLLQASSGDISDATTGRTDNAWVNLIYAFERAPIKVLIGMDRTPVAGIELSHNTYVDLFLRFGIVGACAVFIAVLTKGIKAWGKSKQTNSNETKNILLIKALYGVYGFTLSIYNGPEMVLLTWVFLFL